MKKLEIGDCFIKDNFINGEYKIKRLYLVKDIGKETYTTICIHLNEKGLVTERTDYKQRIIGQMRKLKTPSEFFIKQKYFELCFNVTNFTIPSFQINGFVGINSNI